MRAFVIKWYMVWCGSANNSDPESPTSSLRASSLRFIRRSRSAVHMGASTTPPSADLPLPPLPPTAVPVSPAPAPPLSSEASPSDGQVPDTAALVNTIHISQWLLYYDPAKISSLQRGELVYLGRVPYRIQEMLATRELAEGVVVWAEPCDHRSPVVVILVQPWLRPPSPPSMLAMACGR